MLSFEHSTFVAYTYIVIVRYSSLVAGYWRLLDVDYMDQSFHHILTLLEEEGWSTDNVPLVQCAGKLEELQPK